MLDNADVWIEGNTQIRINYKNAQPQISRIRPSLLFNLELTMANPQGPPSFSELIISDFFVELKQKAIDGKEIFAGQLRVRTMNRELSDRWKRGGVTLIFEVTPNDLKAIEKLRTAQDLQLVISGVVTFEYQARTRKINDQNFTLNIRISKSDWVEKFLPVLGFKNMSLIEIPSF